MDKAAQGMNDAPALAATSHEFCFTVIFNEKDPWVAERRCTAVRGFHLVQHHIRFEPVH
jgi:hypothetical protein